LALLILGMNRGLSAPPDFYQAPRKITNSILVPDPNLELWQAAELSGTIE